MTVNSYFSVRLQLPLIKGIKRAIMILGYQFLRKAQQVGLQSCTQISLVEATWDWNDDLGEISSFWRIRIANQNLQNDNKHSPKASALNICSEKKQNY